MSGVSMSKEKVLGLRAAVEALIQNDGLTRARVDALEFDRKLLATMHAKVKEAERGGPEAPGQAAQERG